MHITIDTIHEQLPQTDCGDCGEQTCKDFALRFATDRSTDAQACPHLSPDAKQELAGLKELFRQRSRLALIVDEDRCTACNECVWVCPINLSLFSLNNVEDMPLGIEDDVVKVQNACGALHSCVRCVEVCPVDAIILV